MTGLQSSDKTTGVFCIYRDWKHFFLNALIITSKRALQNVAFQTKTSQLKWKPFFSTISVTDFKCFNNVRYKLYKLGKYIAMFLLVWIPVFQQSAAESVTVSLPWNHQYLICLPLSLHLVSWRRKQNLLLQLSKSRRGLFPDSEMTDVTLRGEDPEAEGSKIPQMLYQCFINKVISYSGWMKALSRSLKFAMSVCLKSHY